MKASYIVEKSRWGDWFCTFYIDNRPDFDERGTNGTGGKFYETQEKAEQAGKRYLKKMQKNGFDV